MSYLGEPVTQCTNPIEVFTKILKKVDVLHAHHIVHCDLKPRNILIDNDDNISIIDFSHSYILGNFHPLVPNNEGHLRMDSNAPFTINDREAISTYAYTAPETYDTDCLKDTSMDVWSLGCILYELVTGKCLFDSRPKKEDKPCNECDGYLDYIKEQHRHLKTVRANIDQLDTHPIAKTLMKMMLIRNPMMRPTVSELLKFLGVEHNVPIKYDVDMPLSRYRPSKSRLRCYNFPYYPCLLVDNLTDYLKEYTKKSERYELCYLVHMIIASICMNKCGYEPFDTLCTGCDYVRILVLIVTKFDLSKMYGTIIDCKYPNGSK
jgi:serine/threonine protein kinase